MVKNALKLNNVTVRHGGGTPTDSNAIWERQPMTIYHTHHIIPKHMGGTDDPSNLIQLSIEEHAEAHKKLWEEHGKKEDYIAWCGLEHSIDIAELIQEKCAIGGKKGRNECPTCQFIVVLYTRAVTAVICPKNSVVRIGMKL